VSDYYRNRLSAGRLKRVYEVTTPRVRQYLQAEVDHVVQNIRPGDIVLELGFGFGRVRPELAWKAGTVIGIDNSITSVLMGLEIFAGVSNCLLLPMDASRLAFASGSFDCVVCIQNGISAFKVEQTHLMSESLRVARPGAKVLFSSYAEGFWKHRLKWFELQSEAGLLGEIDRDRTCNGVIETRDGFRATTVNRGQFQSMADELGVAAHIVEVDGSSLFCELTAVGESRI
jgi:2-polyprenyl-6-hydroxyphenyl methylase/3-demethylubiquinone-9 3-methyltransferase